MMAHQDIAEWNCCNPTKIERNRENRRLRREKKRGKRKREERLQKRRLGNRI